MKNRTLIDRALQKAEACEKKGDKKEAKKWLAFAEKCERAYNKYEDKNETT